MTKLAEAKARYQTARQNMHVAEAALDEAEREWRAAMNALDEAEDEAWSERTSARRALASQNAG